MKSLSRGFWSGVMATSVMTLGFFRFFHLLPRGERSPLPPGTLTQDALQVARVPSSRLPTSVQQNLSMGAHFGYGIACGLLYALWPRKKDESVFLRGAAYGLGVWSFSYLWLIPALEFRSAAKRMPLRRNLLMIAAHVLWGGALAYSEKELRRSGVEILDGRRKAPNAE